MGLILPSGALVSNYKRAKNTLLDSMELGSRIALKWKDIVYVDDAPQRDCSIMYTEGILSKKENNHIILTNAETVRIHPIPVKHHPLKSPTYYYIPISFIIDTAVISSPKNKSKNG